MKYKEGDVIQIKSAKGYTGLTGVIAGIEPFLVRKIFRTDYLVVMHGGLGTATFKEDEIQLYRA